MVIMCPPDVINSQGILSISGIIPLFRLFIANSTSEFRIGSPSSLSTFNESSSIPKSGSIG